MILNKQIESILQRLNQRESLQALSPKTVWNPALESDIEALDFQGKHSDTRIIALMAGLHLRNDSLDVSHSYAQEIEHDSTGAYWHGIMHRMEGDYFNSKYWFRKTGHHPAMQTTKQRVADWLQAEFDPAAIPSGRPRDILLSFMNDAAWSPSPFADLIAWQETEAATGQLRPVLEHLQHIEISELFDYTLREASRLQIGE